MRFFFLLTGAKGTKKTPPRNMQVLRPTYTHEAIVNLLEKGHIKYLISQNVDGLHRLSGVGEGQISELHGNTFVEKCEKCNRRYIRNFRCGGKATNVPVNKCKHCRINHRTGRLCDDQVLPSNCLRKFFHLKGFDTIESGRFKPWIITIIMYFNFKRPFIFKTRIFHYDNCKWAQI